MRTRVALVVGLLVFGCAGLAWAAAPPDPPAQLIRIAPPSVLAVAALSDADAHLIRQRSGPGIPEGAA